LIPTIFLLLAGLMGAGGIMLAAAGAHAHAAAATGASAGYMLLFHAAAVVGGAALLQQGVVWPPLLILALAGWVLGATLFSGDLALRAFTGTGCSPWRRRPAASSSSLRGSRSPPPH
jgi:uncharacterized membrane protein YgdD (TMEM256/DUF423 family)